MIRLALPGLALFIVLAVWIYAMFDVVLTDRSLFRKLPKPLWVLIVVAVPVLGPIGWLLAGRPLYAGFAPGGTPYLPPTHAQGPEDQPGFGSGAQPSGPSPEQIRRWEQELAEHDDDLDQPGDGIHRSDGHDDI